MAAKKKPQAKPVSVSAGNYRSEIDSSGVDKAMMETLTEKRRSPFQRPAKKKGK